MGAFPFADEDMAIGVQEDDADANMGAGAGCGGHDSDFRVDELFQILRLRLNAHLYSRWLRQAQEPTPPISIRLFAI